MTTRPLRPHACSSACACACACTLRRIASRRVALRCAALRCAALRCVPCVHVCDNPLALIQLRARFLVPPSPAALSRRWRTAEASERMSSSVCNQSTHGSVMLSP